MLDKVKEGSVLSKVMYGTKSGDLKTYNNVKVLEKQKSHILIKDGKSTKMFLINGIKKVEMQ